MHWIDKMCTSFCKVGRLLLPKRLVCKHRAVEGSREEGAEENKLRPITLSGNNTKTTLGAREKINQS